MWGERARPLARRTDLAVVREISVAFFHGEPRNVSFEVAQISREAATSNRLDKPAALRKYGASVKRGVMLLGSPGNGKTMACRWLASECRRLGLAWRSVTAEEYEQARAERSVPELFYLDTPGIVLFDDFDAALDVKQVVDLRPRHRHLRRAQDRPHRLARAHRRKLHELAGLRRWEALLRRYERPNRRAGRQQHVQNLAHNSIVEGTRSTPAIAGGKLYVRTLSHLISLGGVK